MYIKINLQLFVFPCLEKKLQTVFFLEQGEKTVLYLD